MAAHAHPRFSAGGGESAAFSLHEQLQQLDGVESRILAAADQRWLAYGSDLGSLAPDQWLVKRSSCGFYCPSAPDLSCSSDLAHAVRDFGPDVIHFHHYIHLGIDLIFALRQWCPAARMVLTLHEFLAMCAYQGQLLQRDGRLCEGPNSVDCQRCLPDRSAMDLLMREQLLGRTLESFDCLIAPSHYLAQKYVDWAQSRQFKISRPVVIENLLPPLLLSSEQMSGQSVKPTRSTTQAEVFGYFGQLHPNKGIDLLLDAWERVIAVQPRAQLVVHGPLPAGSPDLDQYASHLQARFNSLRSSVTFAGRYSQADLQGLIHQIDWVVMASLWSENSPVVIQEARLFTRPLLVPGLGGMAEKVRDGVDGIHYTPRSPYALSQAILRCSGNQSLLAQLRATMAPPPLQTAILSAHLAEYRKEPSVKIDPFPSVPKHDPIPFSGIRLSWRQLGKAPAPNKVVYLAHSNLPRLLQVVSTSAGNWQVAGELPVPVGGIWQLSFSWNGAPFGQLVWDVASSKTDAEQRVPWSWLIPRGGPNDSTDPELITPGILKLEAVLHGEATTGFVASLVWVAPAHAPPGIGPLQWICCLNRLACLATTCQAFGHVAALDLHGPEEVMAPLRRLWPLLEGAPVWSAGAAVALHFSEHGWMRQPSANSMG